MSLDRETAKRILHEIDDIMDIPYFLIQGTALGAYRDNDFIEYQFDIDLGCLAEEMIPALPRLIRKFKAAGFAVTEISKPMKSTRVIKVDKDGVHTDLCSYWKRGYERFNPNATKNYSIVQPSRVFENTTPIWFMERHFQLPSSIILYLEIEYGPDWKTPKKNGVSASRVYNYRSNHDLF